MAVTSMPISARSTSCPVSRHLHNHALEQPFRHMLVVGLVLVSAAFVRRPRSSGGPPVHPGFGCRVCVGGGYLGGAMGRLSTSFLTCSAWALSSFRRAARVPQPGATAARRKTARRRTGVAKMLDARIFTAGTRIVLTYRSIDHWATISEDGGVVLNATGGTPYGRVDEAGAVVRATKTCQGMKEWHIEDETAARLSLRTL